MTHSEIEVKPIRTKKDYEHTMKLIESLLDCPPKSKDAEVLEVLSILADEYENRHFPIEAPDPIEAIKYRMEQLNLSLTLKMIKALYQNLHIPAEALLA